MKKQLLKSALIVVAGIGLLAGSASAASIPAEWLEIFPSTAADGTQLGAGGSGPAYYLWTDDVDRTSWNLRWTGSGPQSDTNPLYNFFGTIYLQNSTGDIDKFSFDNSNDVLKVNAVIVGANSIIGDVATLDAYAGGGFDGLTIMINSFTSPSYIGFDLKAQEVGGTSVDMSNNIYIGSTNTTVASYQTALGQIVDEDFKIAAPIPEPATMLLFGAGMAGLAGMARRRKTN